jgi:hypothetical protein
MRTTLDIEPDVLDLAKSLADARRISVGKALSSLARKGALATVPLGERNGFSVFPVGDSQVKFGLEDVQAALDAEDARSARDFLKPDSR